MGEKVVVSKADTGRLGCRKRHMCAYTFLPVPGTWAPSGVSRIPQTIVAVLSDSFEDSRKVKINEKIEDDDGERGRRLMSGRWSKKTKMDPGTWALLDYIFVKEYTTVKTVAASETELPRCWTSAPYDYFFLLLSNVMYQCSVFGVGVV